MTLPWLHAPCINLDYVAASLYGGPSRLHKHRLKKKMSNLQPFEQWEIQRLEEIKQDLLYHLKEGSPQLGQAASGFSVIRK